MSPRKGTPAAGEVVEPMPVAPLPPMELRVHGVGGPQATKMLGELHEQDIVTVPPFSVGDREVPEDGETRFAQRLLGSQTEAYEWGGLTVASAVKALWILYLPFTLINAGGWAHAPHAVTDVEDGVAPIGVAVRVRAHLFLAHLASYLATLTYVAWIAYLSMDLIAVRWVAHARMWDFPADVASHPTLTSDLVLVWVPRAAPVLGALLALGIFLTPVRNGRYEKVIGAGGAPEDAGWPAVPTLARPGFFFHLTTHERRLRLHLGVVVAGVAFALGQYMVGWHRLGLVLFGIAVAQIVVLGALLVVDTLSRWRWRPREVFPQLVTDPVVDDKGSRAPAGAAFAIVGTALAHSAFAGAAMLLSPYLARWPEETPTHGELDVGPELMAGDVLAWVLVLAAVAAVVVLVTSHRDEPDSSPAGTAAPGAVIRLARNVPRLLCGLLVAIALPVIVYIGLNVRGALHPHDESGRDCSSISRHITCWYDDYDVQSGAIARKVGSFALLALPGVVFASLRGKHDTGVGRVIGNVWDVLTFWPRRFHPYGAPCSAERAVPELRARIEDVTAGLAEKGCPTEGGPSLVVVAHSQGSVLSAVAIASLDPAVHAPSLVTFGSPIGTLYLPTWPSYVAPLTVDTKARIDAEHPPDRRWTNYWRVTDPIGAEVPGADNVQLHEPQHGAVGSAAVIERLRPLERPARWGTVAGHGAYLADSDVRDAIAARRGDGGPS